MELKKSVFSVLLALTIVGSAGLAAVTKSACANPSSNHVPDDEKPDLNENQGGDTDKADIYNVTLHLNSGKLKDGEDIKSYKCGTTVTLPIPERVGYDFAGWYETADCNGPRVTAIPATATGDKHYYAKWTPKDDIKDDEPTSVYTVNFDLNYEGASLYKSTRVEFGKQVEEPDAPNRDGYDFDGWFTSADGSTKYNFTSGVTASFTLYAHWSAKTYNVTLNFNGGYIVSGTNITSYTFGKGATLPVLERDGYNFDGWYEDFSFNGNKVTEISETDFGDKTYHSKWTLINSSELKVVSVGGYEEGAYIEIDLLNNTSASDYTVSYKSASSGVDAYKTIDSELVRETNGVVRADIVGLSAGDYTIRVTAKNSGQLERTVTASAYDRSGYAHFNYGVGVGAYNSDGTLKSGATVVYVTEETKNTVTLKKGDLNLVGITDILANASKFNGPLVVRIIGTVGAATWNEINYDKGGNYNDGTDYDGNNKLPADKVIGINGKQLPTDHKDITQDELIEGGYNTLNTSVYSELKGLNSKATWSDGEFDSAWNNCSITNASNVTVEGIGTDARIFQWGFTWKQCNSIEVRNLTFEDYPEDACSFEGSINATTVDGFDSNRIWVHHNTFLEGKNYWDICPEQDKHEGDGATDFKKNAYITISYNHYFENHKTGLIGGSDDQTTACVTFHHNWYEKCNSRLPLGREANMHIYNNFYDGSTGTNMSLRAGAYALIENCYFKNASNPITTQEGNNYNKSEQIRGVAKVVNCEFEGCSIGSTYLNNKTVYNYSSNTNNRDTVVDNDNIFSKSFDTDPSIFYYDAVNKKSNVLRLDGKRSVPEVVQELSGVHKNK